MRANPSTTPAPEGGPPRLVPAGFNEYATPSIEHVVRDGSRPPHTMVLSRDVLLIGRAQGNDLLLDPDDRAVARCAAIIERHGDIWTVRRMTANHRVRVETARGDTLDVDRDRGVVLRNRDVIVVAGATTGHEIRLSIPPPSTDGARDAEIVRAGIPMAGRAAVDRTAGVGVGLRTAQRALLAAVAAPLLRPELFDEQQPLPTKEVVKLLKLDLNRDADVDQLARTVDARIGRLINRAEEALGVSIPDRTALVALAIARGLVSVDDFEHDERLVRSLTDRARERGLAE